MCVLVGIVNLGRGFVRRIGYMKNREENEEERREGVNGGGRREEGRRRRMGRRFGSDLVNERVRASLGIPVQLASGLQSVTLTGDNDVAYSETSSICRGVAATNA